MPTFASGVQVVVGLRRAGEGAREKAGSGARPGGRSRLHASGGFTMIEMMAVLVLMGIVLVAAWGWQGAIATWKVKNAASLLEGDLRYARQMAITDGGSGPQVEVCFRPGGYDVYTTVYSGSDPLDVNMSSYTASAGTVIKSVNSGQEYGAGVQFALPGSTGTVSCTVDSTRQAIAFRSSGQPAFQDSNSHSVTVTYQGHSALVTIQSVTGAVSVGQ